MAIAKNLVIVESPTKAKTIGKFLGKDFVVESSFGHIRDLPKKEMGVDIEHDFAPTYVIPRDNTKRVTGLKKLAKNAEHVYFATDEDREGEAIAWHLKEALGVPESKSIRIAFHEITESAVRDALEHPRSIDLSLVDAQQARRVLDRLVGYELSPFLWRKIAKGLSAGRVQSVAVRLIVEREREILAFVQQEYWTIEIDFLNKEKVSFHTKLSRVDDKSLDKFAVTSEEEAKKILDVLQGAAYTILSVEKKAVSKKPSPPFTTSTLQQDANRRLRFSPKQTMMLAQQLYEGIEKGNEAVGGYITYMRTDSVSLSQKFLDETQEYAAQRLGDAYTKGARKYTTKSKGAQEAHESIRPTVVSRTPESVKDHLTPDQHRLYELIWRRAVASQLPDALYEATTIDVEANTAEKHTFRASGQVETFDGFTRVYPSEGDDMLLPKVTKGESVGAGEIMPMQHFTKPPARYSEAGLVKVMEEKGIGRPSTYAPTISTIIDRGYATREERRLKPGDMAFVTNDLLVAHFPEIVDFDFTAKMEENLDDIAEGTKQWVPVIRDFYVPFKKNLKAKDKELSKKDLVEETDIVCEKCGKPMVIKLGRFGKFLACTGFPDCKNTKPVEEVGKDGEHVHTEPLNVEPCEKCGSEMVMKQGRYGKFLACSKYPDCKNIRSLSDIKTGIPCPECKEGEVIQKKSKRGKIFFGCTRYPDCKYTSWEKPSDGGAATDVVALTPEVK